MTKAAPKQSAKSRKTPRIQPPNLKQRKQAKPEPAKPARHRKISGLMEPKETDTANCIGAGSRSGTKQSRVITMLREPGGATMGAMIQATGWQQHSVRGFLAGVINKKLRLHLVSEAGESGRVYRIVDRLAQASHAA